MKHLRSHHLAALLAAATVLAGCTSTGDQASGTGDFDGAGSDGGAEATETTETDYVVAFAEPDAEDFNRLLEPTRALQHRQSAPILDVETITPTELVVSFEMESHHCFGPQTSVEETEREIIVELWTGPRAGVEPGTCTYGVYPYTTLIELDRAIGDRTVTPAEPREDEPEEREPSPDDSTEDPSRHLIGRFVEDGVEWAIEHDTAWRVLSYEGVASEDTSPADPDRIGFVVEQDRIVGYEWS